MPILDQIPIEIRSGDTCIWYHADPDFSPDDGWTLVYTLLSNSGKIDITATDNGDGRWLVTLTAANNVLPAGVITWLAIVALGEEKHTVNSGRLEALVNLADAVSHDGRSHVRKMLEALEARIEGRAGEDQLELTIGDKSIKLMSLGEIISARAKYRKLLKTEEAEELLARGMKTTKTVRVRFC